VTSTDRSARGFAVAGIVLAAGSSTRFGADKRLHRVDGTPMVRRAAETAVAAGLDPVVVVVGPEHGAVAGALSGLAVELAVNPEPGRGSRTSLRAGFDTVPPNHEACVVLLADMPAVEASMVEAVADRLRSGAALVQSRYGGVTAPPTGFARALFAELVGEGDDGGRSIVARHARDTVYIDWPQGRLVDIDAPSDHGPQGRLTQDAK
jgi:molybdenum cofactor cytidylyltransferase